MRPDLFARDSWSRHQERVAEILESALQRLADTSPLPESENDLNRALLFRFKEENQRLRKEGRGVSAPIYYECSNQPLDEVERATWESKRPDFNVGYVDDQLGRDMFLYIEAKRLGVPLKSGWKLNEQYFENGVQRFVNVVWSYGAGQPSAIMIGYLQTCDHDAALSEANAHGTTLALPEVARVGAVWNARGVSQLGQTLIRTFEPSPFPLNHFWVDLRHCSLIARASTPRRKRRRRKRIPKRAKAA